MSEKTISNEDWKVLVESRTITSKINEKAFEALIKDPFWRCNLMLAPIQRIAEEKNYADILEIIERYKKYWLAFRGYSEFSEKSEDE